MSIIILLLAVSLLLGTTFLLLFVRAVRSGQYEDTTTPALRILADDAPDRLVGTEERKVKKRGHHE